MAYQVATVSLRQENGQRKNFADFFRQVRDVAIEVGAKPEDCYFEEGCFYIPKADAMNATPFESCMVSPSVERFWPSNK